MLIHDRYPYPSGDPPCPAGSAAYVIRSGDTFYTIAQRLGTTVAAIMALNPGVNPDTLQVGQEICVPLTGPGPGACPGGTVYTVQPGDTLFALAGRLGITLRDLIAVNPGIDPDRLAVGQTICLPLPLPSPTLIQTPFCSLLRPVFPVLPQITDIPIGSVTVRQVAMSTRAYTIVASPLPDPGSLGNYDVYIGVLYLITGDPSRPRTTVILRLVPSSFANQLVTWAGTIITLYPPIVGDSAEIRPSNSATGTQGPVLLKGDLIPCRA